MLREMIEKSPAFIDSRNAFRDVKRRLRAINALPPPLFMSPLASDFLVRLLPERALCEHWTFRYFQTYGRLFDFIHPKGTRKIIETIWSEPSSVRASSTALVLLVMSVAMQNDDDNRLLGRRLAQHLQDFFYSSGLLRRPNIEVFQNLCLLVLLKYVAASDTDKFDGMSNALGKTQQMAFEMGLHRDPALFPTISPYNAGLRTRLWSNFFRLALEYSVQTGTPLIIRTEDVDCPLPTNASWDDVDENVAVPPIPKDLSIMTESTFGIVMCKLATLAATTQQAICSPNSRISPESCRGLRGEFQQILIAIPARLRCGTPNVDSITRLQQNLIAMLVHRSSLLISTHLLLIRCAPESHYKTLLFDMWDSSCSILHSIQTISKDADSWRIGYQLSWADACRAAFSAAMVLQKLRNQDTLSITSSVSRHTTVPLQNTLNECLFYMTNLWLQRVQFGPSVAKAYLHLSSLTIVSSMCMRAEQNVVSENDLLAAGVKSANQNVEKIRQVATKYHSAQLQRQPQQHPNLTCSMLTSSNSDSSQLSATALASSPLNHSPKIYAKDVISNLARGGRMDTFGMYLDDLQFDPSYTVDGLSQPLPQDFFNSASTPAFTPRRLQHQSHSCPAAREHTCSVDLPIFHMDAAAQPASPMDDAILMPWIDQHGRTNSLPMDFDSSWGN
jgi:Fungal specific transcription factor domain